MLHPRIESAFNLSGQPQMASDKRKFKDRHLGIWSFNLQPYTPNPAPFFAFLHGSLRNRGGFELFRSCLILTSGHLC